MPDYEAVLFDFDGVLLDSEPVTPVGVVTTRPDRSPMFAVTSR